MAVSTGGGEDEVMSTINITPFTDVLLVLLIIFIILASVTKEPKLPDAYNKDKVQPSQIVVLIDEKNNISIGSNQVKIPDAKAAFAQLQDADRPQVQERDHQSRSARQLRRHSAGHGRRQVGRPHRLRPGQSRRGTPQRDEPSSSWRSAAVTSRPANASAALSAGRSSFRSSPTWRSAVLAELQQAREEQKIEKVR